MFFSLHTIIHQARFSLGDISAVNLKDHGFQNKKKSKWIMFLFFFFHENKNKFMKNKVARQDM